MTKIKFYECFTGNKKVSIEDMVTSNGRLRRQYNPDALYCPLCKKARLKFTSATSQRVAYLSTWPGSIHKDGCTYAFEPCSKAETISFYADLEKTPRHIYDLLSASVNFLRRENSSSYEDLVDLLASKNPYVTPIQKGREVIKKVLPRRSIKFVRNTTGEFLDIPIIFTGIVKIEIEKRISKKNNPYYSIHLLDPNTDKQYLYLVNEDLKHMPTDIVEDQTYYFSFLGSYTEPYQTVFPELYPPLSHYFYYEPVD